MVDLSTLNPPVALGSLDGRYRAVSAPLTNYLSEAALNRARLAVEVEWLIYLTDQQLLPGTPQLAAAEKNYLHNCVEAFGSAEINELAQIEAVTRHDVKAVEYFLKRRLDAAPQQLGNNTVLPKLHELVHIFCTSEDINNLAYALTVKAALTEVWVPAAQKLISKLTAFARKYATTPMLARTHGQAATPTTVGKELAVFAWRLSKQLQHIKNREFLGKFNGATGTYGAHVVSAPQINWQEASRKFVELLGLVWNPLTTQIESHDWQAELYSDISHFNRIAHNFSTDAWTYISLGYFHQKLSAQGATGSSTMPHKVNPIRFENGEANLEISSALFDTLAATLVTSRLQRDLTDSSTQRNLGVAFGHSLLALDNLCRGLDGLEVNSQRLAADLNNAWEVLAEPIQQAIRAANLSGATTLADPYERLKELTRGKAVTRQLLHDFINTLALPPEVKERLLALTPASYTGLAAQLVDHLEEIGADTAE